MKYRILFCLAGLLLYSSMATGGPFLIEEASTLQKDRVLLRARVLFTKFPQIREPGLFEENPPDTLTGINLEGDIWTVPLEVRVGLTDRFTFCLATSYIYHIQTATDWGSSNVYSLSNNGFSHVEVKGLYRIMEEDRGVPGLSLLAKAYFPLGDDDYCARDRTLKLKLPLGERGITIGLWEVISKGFGSIRVHVNLGYELRLPYVQKKDSLGESVNRSIDPGDKAIYGLAVESRFQNISVLTELNGRVIRDTRLNNANIPGSGRHIIQVLCGLQFRPGPGITLEAGIFGTVLSAGGNKNYYYGPILGLSQRF